ncbi:HK97 family phage prohead protease [Dysgonomonas sp. Marseille-P4361]|uniref:HK97 family phage prohead protease n=1 Tax=Dysgonomonas sp. Marseille-P4361 TaxID=2161820 RepID=UPI000D55769A|nr:HK97 family phage prohead protease [Dysgonomonas sp. Marseille-P4361]
MDEKVKGATQDEKDFTLSDGSRINTKGFRVDLAGGRYERFDNNPVMLYDHDTKQVIGRWENRRLENVQMKAKPVFDMGDPAAAEIARKVKEGFLKGASIGLIPYKMEQIGDDYVLTDWELIEASVTPIPSDPGAVRLYNEKREEISFEQFKLSFNNSNNNKNSKQMDEKDTIVLTAATRQSLGLSVNPTAKEIELAVAEKDTEIDKLEKENKKLKEAEIDTYLSQAVKDGKLTQDEVADQRELALLNFDKVKALIDKKPAQAGTSLNDLTKRTNLTTGDRAGWDYLKWSQDDPRGLEKLRADNPKEYERLLTEFQNKQ